MYPAIEDAWKKSAHSESDWWAGQLEKDIKDFSSNQLLKSQIEGTVPFGFDGLIGAPAGAKITVLDLGSGPVATLGSVSDRYAVNVVAVDPLAQEYTEILDRCGVIPRWRARYASAEDLDKVFEANTFDFVNCRNALDHAIDPFRGIWQTMRVLKPGAAFFLHGSENEGAKQNYEGLHQWNFEVRGTEFFLWRPGVEINIGVALADVLTIESALGEGWYRVVLRKQA